MNVLQLISSGGMYGAEMMLVNLAVSLEQLGCRNVVAVFENQHRPHLEIADCARTRGPDRGGSPLPRPRGPGRCWEGSQRDPRSQHRSRAHACYKAALYGYLAARK